MKPMRKQVEKGWVVPVNCTGGWAGPLWFLSTTVVTRVVCGRAVFLTRHDALAAKVRADRPSELGQPVKVRCTIQVAKP